LAVLPLLVLSVVTCLGQERKELEQIIKDRGQQIHSLLSERKNIQELVEELKQQEWGVLEVLKVLNGNIQTNLEKLNSIGVEIKEVEEDIRLATLKIEGLKQQIKQDKNRLHQQLLVLFYLRKIKQMTLFLGTGSVKDYFRNQKLLQKNSELDALTINRLNENLSELETENIYQMEQKIKLTDLKQSWEEQKNLLAFEQQQQFTYLHHIRQDRSLRVKYLGAIQVELEKLNDTIHTLEIKKENEQKAKRFSGLYRYKYSLPSPVKGTLVHRFGQSNSRFYTLFKRGVLVDTENQQEVHSILQGKVVWSGPFHGYRNLIILDHGKGSFSVYGNLDEVFVITDDVVDQNQRLGTVALNDTEEKYLFYFETRYNKLAVNPEQWLKRPSWN
jgi:septal ring factor EnvC (AmiA/AmiB activator)